MRRSGGGLLLALAMFATAGPADAQQAPAPGAPLRLEALETRVLASHPALREATARVDEARGRAVQAGAWSNPTVGAVAQEVRPPERSIGVFGAYVEQQIPLGGKRSAARTESERETARREADLEVTRQRVLTRVRAAYFDVLTAEERLTTIERLTTLANEAVEINRQLFNVGVADQPDVLQGEVEAARVRLDLVQARERRQAAWHRLAAVADQPLAPGPLALSVETAFPMFDRQTALEHILAESPAVRTAAGAVARERAGIGVARRMTAPDLFLRGDAGWNREPLASNGGPLGWEFDVEVGLSLPFFNRNRGGIAAAVASASAAEAAEARVRLEIRTRFADIFEEYETARTAAVTYKADILPRAQRAYEMYLAKYREMAAPYPQVLMAQRGLLQMTEQYINAVEHAWRAVVRLQGFVVEDD
ncbi:MAG: TolC family protein [Acidobacteriota bacterium]